jgi:hypothetical protein
MSKSIIRPSWCESVRAHREWCYHFPGSEYLQDEFLFIGTKVHNGLSDTFSSISQNIELRLIRPQHNSSSTSNARRWSVLKEVNEPGILSALFFVLFIDSIPKRSTWPSLPTPMVQSKCFLIGEPRTVSASDIASLERSVSGFADS